MGGYLNEIPNDEVLLIKDLLVSLVHSSYSCFGDGQGNGPAGGGRVIPESYLAQTQLPAFVGRYHERDKAI